MGVLKLANRQGIPCLEVVSIDVKTDRVVFNIANHPQFRENFQGLFLIRVDKTYAVPASTTLPIKFATAGVPDSEIDLKGLGGIDFGTDDLNTTGIYLLFYDRPTNILQIISRNS